MYYDRTVSAKLKSLASYFPAVAVTGARQSGKTTLLRESFPDYAYVSLDLPSIADQAERNPEDFIATHGTPLIVDEVQYAPGLLRHLKRHIDAERHLMGRFLITGSQHFSLMKGVTESLAGRLGLLELETLAAPEITQHRDVLSGRKPLVSLMARGQFPELWRVPELPARDFYAAYLATYLERDVRQIMNVTSLRDFERFMRILATRGGSLLNKSDVARDVGVSVKAVGDWLSVLHASGQIVLLEPWFTTISKRMVKTPKLYFQDSGLLCFLLSLTEDTLPTSPYMGAVWETLVFSELRKAAATTNAPVSFWFYRDQRNREIDFVVDTGGRLSFLEAKWQEHPTLGDGGAIRTISRELEESRSPWRPGMHYVLGTPQVPYTIVEGLDAVRLRDVGRIVSDAGGGVLS